MPVPRSRDLLNIVNPDMYVPIVAEKIDRRMLPDEFAPLFEVNTSASRSKFTIRLFRPQEDEADTNILNGECIVRLQHSESTGFISSDDNDFTGDNLAEVFLWNYKGKSTDIEANSSQTYFELEIVGDSIDNLGANAAYSGNTSNESSSHGGMVYRLRHLNTGRLVVMQEIDY